jgi:hypothetical protein
VLQTAGSGETTHCAMCRTTFLSESEFQGHVEGCAATYWPGVDTAVVYHQNVEATGVHLCPCDLAYLSRTSVSPHAHKTRSYPFPPLLSGGFGPLSMPQIPIALQPSMHTLNLPPLPTGQPPSMHSGNCSSTFTTPLISVTNFF